MEGGVEKRRKRWEVSGGAWKGPKTWGVLFFFMCMKATVYLCNYLGETVSSFAFDCDERL